MVSLERDLVVIVVDGGGLSMVCLDAERGRLPGSVFQEFTANLNVTTWV
jgi:hypothetical protein